MSRLLVIVALLGAFGITNPARGFHPPADCAGRKAVFADPWTNVPLISLNCSEPRRIGGVRLDQGKRQS